MRKSFLKMMREQVQTDLNDLNKLAHKPVPKGGSHDKLLSKLLVN